MSVDELTRLVMDDPTLPPGLPPIVAPRTRLLWWHGALAMLFAVIMLVIANVAVAVVVLVAQYGVDGVASAMADQRKLITFPLMAAGSIANLFVFLVVAALVPFVARVPHKSALGLGGAPPSSFVWGALGILGLGPLADRIVTTLKPYFPEQSALEMIEAAVSGQPLWVLVPVLAVAPAIGEELLCRGVLQRSIPSPSVALPVSAVFFAGLHMDPLQSSGVLHLGLYLAWLGHRTRSVWVPVFAHLINNLAATLAMHFTAGEDLTTTDVLPLWAVPAGLVLTFGAMALLHRGMRITEVRALSPASPALELENPP